MSRDNCLAALETDTSIYVFVIPADAVDTNLLVSVMLYYHRAYKMLMDQKGWPDADILMKQAEITLAVE